MNVATYIGVDLASGKGHAVLVEYRNGAPRLVRELDLENSADWAGLKVDGVWVDEMEILP